MNNGVPVKEELPSFVVVVETTVVETIVDEAERRIAIAQRLVRRAQILLVFSLVCLAANAYLWWIT